MQLQPDPAAAVVAVFGLGRVGLVSAAGFAAMGHIVIGYEVEVERRNAIRLGRAPFVEPELDGLVREAVSSGRLQIAETPAEALKNASYALVCVGTPAGPGGTPDLGQLQTVLSHIAAAVPALTPRQLTIVIRSTVFTGTCESLAEPLFASYPNVSVVMNPEFLREGSAVEDFLNPALIVVGGNDVDAVERVAALYKKFPVEPQRTSSRVAEMIKLSCNAFHAVKVAFANEIGALAAANEVDPQSLFQVFVQDRRLNLSPAYLTPGMPFGGSCLAKDLQNITLGAGRAALSLPLLNSVLESNGRHAKRLVDNILNLEGQHIGLIGLAFKAGIDDTRDSQLVALLESLSAHGRHVRFYDELAQTPGTLKPHHEASLSGLVRWADFLLAGRKLSPNEQKLVEAGGKPVYPLSHLALDAQRTRYNFHSASAG